MSAKKIAIISIWVNLLLLGGLAYLLKQPPPPSIIVLETNAPVQFVEKRVEVPGPGTVETKIVHGPRGLFTRVL